MVTNITATFPMFFSGTSNSYSSKESHSVWTSISLGCNKDDFVAFCNRFLLDKKSLKTLCYSSVHDWWHWWNLDFPMSHGFIDLSVVPLTQQQNSGCQRWCQERRSLESENWWTTPVLNKSNEGPPQMYPACLSNI